MENIFVAIRIRPEEKNAIYEKSNYHACVKQESLTLETESRETCNNTCVTYDSRSIIIQKKVNHQDKESNSFSFDKIFDESSSQEDVFNSCRKLVDASLCGYNATIFAFGMTGSGKTHTISGDTMCPGIVPRAVEHIFTSLRQSAKESESYISMVFLTYLELYNNSVFDLLSPDSKGNLRIHDHPTQGITVTGSPSIRTKVCSVEEALALINSGTKHRATATTNLNERSSRSHTIITIEIVRQVIGDSSTSNDKDTSVGKINLVDLAGSERVKLSGAEG
jgi:hypothetical protein